MTEIAARDLLARLRARDAALLERLEGVYGAAALEERLSLLAQTVSAFVERFGNVPVRAFRAPSRVNLRGMHVDTHGGNLAMVTHQRETVVVAAKGTHARILVAHVDNRYPDVGLDPAAQDGAESVRSGWAKYVEGAYRAVATHAGGVPPAGASLMVAGDVPRGASISSSASLCVALVHAFAGLLDRTLTSEAVIELAREAEWFAGARTGTSDQAAIALGRRGQLLAWAPNSQRVDAASARYVRWPSGVSLLAVDSVVRRQLAGSASADYVRNRFAYSLALPILADVVHAEHAAKWRLADWAAMYAADVDAFYDAMLAIPLEAETAVLRDRHALPNFEAHCAQYYPDEGSVPDTVPLRGPLVFGIAESARAAVFPDALADGDFAQAGALMGWGHDGDRIRTPDGARFSWDASDDAMRLHRENRRPIHELPGVYGASVPALDSLVDASLAAGAFGASLTGAGLGGTVAVLCDSENVRATSLALLEHLDSPAYRRLLSHHGHSSGTGVVVNRIVDGAGPLDC